MYAIYIYIYLYGSTMHIDSLIHTKAQTRDINFWWGSAKKRPSLGYPSDPREVSNWIFAGNTERVL